MTWVTWNILNDVLAVGGLCILIAILQRRTRSTPLWPMATPPSAAIPRHCAILDSAHPAPLPAASGGVGCWTSYRFTQA